MAVIALESSARPSHAAGEPMREAAGPRGKVAGDDAEADAFFAPSSTLAASAACACALCFRKSCAQWRLAF